jgi:hypothetical protein
VLVRERLLLRVQVRAAGDHEALGVEQPAALARRRLVEAVGHHRQHRQLAMPVAALPAPWNRIFWSFIAVPVTRTAVNRPGQRNGGGALDVVVEGRDAVAVLLQQPRGVMVGEILELHHRLREARADRGDELLHQRVVVGAGEALLVQADVERVLEEFRVVGADIEHHGQAFVGRHAGARGVERELAHRDAHAVGRRGRPGRGCARRR